MAGIEPVLYIGIAQSFFAGLLISTKRPFTTSNKLMAAWVFLLCIELIFALVNSRVLQFYSFPFIAFTYGPLLYLYACHVTRRKEEFNYVNLLHFMPFIAFFTVSVWFRDYQLFRNPTSYLTPDSMISLRLVYGISFFLSVSVYSILTFIVIRNHQRELMHRLSYTSITATLNWLKIISISFYSVYLIVFILGGINIIGNYIPFDPYYVLFVFVALLSFAFSFYGVKQPELFSYSSAGTGDFETDDTAGTATPGQEKYLRSGLKSAQAHEMLAILIKVMQEQKPYLERDLSVYDLSSLTGISRHHITQVLNETHGRNFYTFVNEYRVNEAVARITDKRYSHYTILAIAYDSGFNSKSAFNKVFREHMGMTPSEYRDQQTAVTRL